MIPVTDLNSIQVCWLRLEREGFVLFGFLLYTNADTGIWSFIHNGGMLDLDHITGSHCAVFVLDRPPRDFVVAAQKKNHVWYRYFGESFGPRPGIPANATKEPLESAVPAGGFSNNTLQHLNNCVVVIGPENQVAAESLLEGATIDRDEIGKVLDHFGLDFSAVPCLTWFRRLDDTAFEIIDLRSITDQHSAKRFFRQYFATAEFKRLLSHTRV